MEETGIVLLKEEQTNKRIGLILFPPSSPKQSGLTDFSILAEGNVLPKKGKRVFGGSVNNVNYFLSLLIKVSKECDV